MSRSDGPNGRAPESADFAGHVPGSRRRPPIVLLGWIAVLAGVVALGLSGRSGGIGATASETAAATVGTAAARPSNGAPGASFGPVGQEAPPRFDPDFPTFPPRVVVETSAPGPISLQASRHPSTIFVHGDVFAQQVTWVFVSLQSLDGQVGGWASVSIPGAAGDGRDHRPALRFDVELAVPTAMATGVLVVQANSYNAAGALIASTKVRLSPDM